MAGGGAREMAWSESVITRGKRESFRRARERLVYRRGLVGS
jgi:hypothetical protein